MLRRWSWRRGRGRPRRKRQHPAGTGSPQPAVLPGGALAVRGGSRRAFTGSLDQPHLYICSKMNPIDSANIWPYERGFPSVMSMTLGKPLFIIGAVQPVNQPPLPVRETQACSIIPQVRIFLPWPHGAGSGAREAPVHPENPVFHGRGRSSFPLL
ncbi:hypothetical protein D3C75_752090 [compost metagenome]